MTATRLRGEIAATKIVAEWKGKAFVGDACHAATELGLLQSGNWLSHDRAKFNLEFNFGTNKVDPIHWQPVYGAYLNGRGTVITSDELQQRWFPTADNDNERFQVTWFDDVDQSAAKEEILQGILGAGEFSVFVAKPGMGKSVLVGDIGMHIAAGMDWHGRKVKQGLVIYFAAERKRLTERRVAAWAKKHGVTDIPFVVVGGKLDMTSTLIDATALAATIADLEATSGFECVLVILDTVTRTFGPGDQHQSRDMQRYIQSVDTLTRATGAHIAVIHHSPHSDDGRAKGAIDLDGGCDASFVVKVQGTGLAKVFTLSCTGANDGEDGPVMSFRLESVALGSDADGKITTAPVVVPVDTSADDGSTMKTSSALALEFLERAIAEHGDGDASVTRDQWRERFYADTRAKEPDIAVNTLKRRFARATADLADTGKIEATGDQIWLAVHAVHVPVH
jgi:AAA domain